MPLLRKPFVRSVVLNVSRINQGNQYIDVKKEAAHSSSSRS